MKTIIAVAAVAAIGAFAASPVLAKSAPRHVVSGPVVAAPAGEWRDSAAQDDIAPWAAADPNAVYVDGRYAGADPDPNVRMQLKDDYYHTYYGG